MTTTTTPDALRDQLLAEITQWPIIDPHSHINPHSPAAHDWDEILAYHYYTELAHSAGMPADHASPDLARNERLAHLAESLPRFDNTVQHGWLTQIAREFHGVDGPLDPSTIETVIERANHHSDSQDWDHLVWNRTNLQAVFLTNEFDDPLEGFDTSRFVPCLRTDDLVFKLHHPRTVERLEQATDIDIQDERSFRLALGALFAHFKARGAKACAISLPPDFIPRPATPRRAVTPIRRALHGLPLRPDEHEEIRTTVFWALTEFCAEFALPFDLMIGVHRDVYPAGVAGGRDLLDRRVSLHDYAPLFRHFPTVNFPVSMLAADAAAELIAYAWIFPNVVPMGHWWYANIPAFIEPDLRARLQAVPKTKLVGYYSDAYKLEFIKPKFAMYHRVLAQVLADDCIRDRGLGEDQAIDLARHLLVDNPRRIFGLGDAHGQSAK